MHQNLLTTMHFKNATSLCHNTHYFTLCMLKLFFTIMHPTYRSGLPNTLYQFIRHIFFIQITRNQCLLCGRTTPVQNLQLTALMLCLLKILCFLPIPSKNYKHIAATKGLPPLFSANPCLLIRTTYTISTSQIQNWPAYLHAWIAMKITLFIT